MSVTIDDIARQIGISKSSVSRALNGKLGVSDQSRKRILREAKRQEYHPNAIARGLVSKSSRTIGLILPDITNPFFPEVARGIEDSCRRSGYNVLICNTNWSYDQELKCLQALQMKRVDGIIIELCSLENTDFIDKWGVPAVFINTNNELGNRDFIGINNEEASCFATDYLIRCGYKKIAFAGGSIRSYSNVNRMKGYKKALKNMGVDNKNQIVTNGKFDTESGYEMARNLFLRADPPDAILCGNDIIALGVLQFAHEKKLDIPERLGIIGFDDVYTSGLPQIQLTTVSIPKLLLGNKAVTRLLEKIDSDEVSCKQVVLQYQLVIRKTTRDIHEQTVSKYTPVI